MSSVLPWPHYFVVPAINSSSPAQAWDLVGSMDSYIPTMLHDRGKAREDEGQFARSRSCNVELGSVSSGLVHEHPNI